MAGVSAGCVLALVPALLPSARSGGRWPHVVMALGMAAGHAGFVAVAVLALLAAGWWCGSPSRRAEAGHHIHDFVVMSVLLVLTATGGSDHVGAGHAHGGGSAAGVAVVIGVLWTCARLVRVLPERDGRRQGWHRGLGLELCSAGMAASMAFMAVLAL
ncbi:hypothetical protein GCM10009733_011530 [Nonomuraea maheshkhaliensis]|uniref:DUF5134 domain-containing protein n=1 Tax=Nonomuraea maheshkhaliensis TaxID=419590 RepID=A0ABN2EUD1_9ACTN